MAVLIFLYDRIDRVRLHQGLRRRGAGPGREAAMNTTARQRVGWGAANVIVLLIAVIPVLWLVSLSLKDPSTLTDGSFYPHKWTFENYRGIFDQPLFTHALVNSIGIALISTLLGVVLGAMAAYAIARLDFPGRRAHRVGPSDRDLPQISLVNPMFNLWRTLGIFDTWLGLVIPYITFSLPLAIYTLSAFFREIPWELERAAALDGATPMQSFRRVILPLAAPGVFTTAILVFLICWNDFVFAISLTSTDNARTVPAAIAFFTGASQFEQPTGSIAAAAIVITIPVIIVVMLFQRRIVAGLTAGAVKG